MLNNFCFHLYAQKSLFIAENCNAFFFDKTFHLCFFWDHISTRSIDIRVHRAGSQLKMLPCSEGECNNYVWISITMQNILYQLDCACYYKIRQTIVLILRPSEHSKTSTSKRYISRSTCLKFNLKTVLNSDNHGGSNSRTAALIITLAKSVLSPLAAPLCTDHTSDSSTSRNDGFF